LENSPESMEMLKKCAAENDYVINVDETLITQDAS
jgi:hypothetical protein